jgi:membrane protease YdiL (CAAX protease family)
MPYSTLPVFVTWLVWGLLWAGLCLGLCAARFAAAPRLLSLAALACAGHACALVLPPWPVWAYALGLPETAPTYVSAFAAPPVEWQPKVAALAWSVLLLVGGRWITPAEAGLRRPLPGTIRAVLPAVLLLALGLLVNAYLTRHTARTLWLHERVFYATLPGLEEEVFYRGLLPALLGRVFARSIPLPGTRTSWGGVVGVLLFTLGHSLKFHGEFFQTLPSPLFWRYVQTWLSPAYFLPSDVLYVLAMGSFFLWVRERTGSCWVAVITHCLLNSCVAIGSHFP